MPDYKLAQIAGVDKSVIARTRRKSGIPSYADVTGSTGRFTKGMPHPRWSRKTSAGIPLENRTDY